ncbi:modifier of mdg4-like isoform X2 [Agrilus planipennis]|uniref:Modifier of mdg4-like isoform X2 n=1 Tax=Agrilus planipennis TaxID=224129 RepID=A0A1W4XF80_AGRPL|nr:modifier of mdg4-like isoform X2 [Agrilus planipennis]
MAPTELFSLKWNNFYSNLTSGFHDLLAEHDMVDVTIAVEGHFLQAHKIVLSVCSPFFKQLFKINPCKHPIVILNDISLENLKDILEFMYLGEVNVLKDNLASFLRTAQLLQVKGLTGDETNDTSSKNLNKREAICEQHTNNQLEDSTKFSLLPNDQKQSHSKNSSPAEKISVKKAKQELIFSQQSLVRNFQKVNGIDLSNNGVSGMEDSNISHYSEFSSAGDKEHFTFNKETHKDAWDIIVPNSLVLQDNNHDNAYSML